MPFKQVGAVRYFFFDIFKHAEITHAIFTRRGGISPNPWKSLNMGGTVGDDHERVGRNMGIALDAIGCDLRTVHDVWQVHGNNVFCVSCPRDPDIPHIKADAMVTDIPDVTLLMRFADCVPILLFDPNVKAIAQIHAGWQGTVSKIAVKTVKVMVETFGCKPQNIIAGIGPSICVDHYTIGKKVEKMVRRSFQKNCNRVLVNTRDKVKFDLWEANRLLLIQAGLHEIEIAEICTACHMEDWYSHRGESGKTGRFGSLMKL
jgi:YfiH family protein